MMTIAKIVGLSVACSGVLSMTAHMTLAPLATRFVSRQTVQSFCLNLCVLYVMTTSGLLGDPGCLSFIWCFNSFGILISFPAHRLHGVLFALWQDKQSMGKCYSNEFKKQFGPSPGLGPAATYSRVCLPCQFCCT